jgi:aldehyde dehydrogenase (NAD+)
MATLTVRDLENVMGHRPRSICGRAAGLWTRAIGMAQALAAGVRAGTMWVNCRDVIDAAAPSARFT